MLPEDELDDEDDAFESDEADDFVSDDFVSDDEPEDLAPAGAGLLLDDEPRLSLR